MHRSATLALVGLLTDACTGDSPKPAATGQMPADAPARAPREASGSTISGVVREQIAVGPYVYLRLDIDGTEEWAAVNQTPVKEGDRVTVYNVMRMDDFPSQSLKRTFARIYFGSLDPNAGAGSSTGPNAMPGGTAGPLGEAQASPGTPAATDAKVGRLEPARGANAFTIGDLFAKQTTLAGQPVSVRGVVVKYNPGVMGKNWIHLQDGSGNSAAGTHDLTVTSNGTAAMGDTVTVTGVVRINKDYGAGYVYPLVIEDAKVVRR